MAGKEAETEEWPDITREERIQQEILFYSQGPLNGFLIGERARDLFLHSKLPLTVLSQIWNLADASNDNLLDADEFVTAMHLIQGVLQGKKVPKALPKNLVIKKSPLISMPSMSEGEKEAYVKVFQSYDVGRKGYIDGIDAIGLFSVSKLPAEQLADVWDWSDVNRDGHLDPDEFAVACHLLRHLKKEDFKLEGTVDVFTYLPQRISATSLKARKDRTDQYERHKQRLMLLKEKRKAQIARETKRLQLLKEKSELEKELFQKLKSSSENPIKEEEISKITNYNTESIEKLEEIVARLKKEHEKVRQETVQVILGEQKLQTELRLLKNETDELNKRLSTPHTKATKDPDPFHQLYEQRKEERKKSNLSEGEEPEIHLPFQLNPFDKESLNKNCLSGSHLFLNSHSNDNNNTKISPENQTFFEELHEFGDKFVDLWCPSSEKNSGVNMDSLLSEEEDSIFMTVEVSPEDDQWVGVGWKDDSLKGLNDSGFISLHKKLVDLKAEMQKLNGEAGGKMVFRNPSDYLARKKEKEEEEQKEKSKYPRRSKSTADKDYAAKRRSYILDRKNADLDSETSDRRLNRRSYNLDQRTDKNKAPDRPRQQPIRTSDSQIPRASARTNRDRPLSADVTLSAVSPTKSVSPTTSPTRLSSTKKTRAPAPPTSPVSKLQTSPPPTKESKLPLPIETPERPPRKKDSGSPTSPTKPLEHTSSSNNTDSNNQTNSNVRKSFLFSYHRDEEDKPVTDTKSDIGDIKVNLNGQFHSPEEKVPVIKPQVNKEPEKAPAPCVISKTKTKDSTHKSVHPPPPQLNSKQEVESELILPKPEKVSQKSPVQTQSESQKEIQQIVTNIQVDEPVIDKFHSEFVENTPEILNLDLEKISPSPDQISLNDVETTESEDKIVPIISKDRLSLDIPSSDTVSLCSVDSIPPALPDSEPPLLPSLPGVSSPIQEEVVEIVTSPRVESAPPVVEAELTTSSKEEKILVEKDLQSSTLLPVQEDIIEVVTHKTEECIPQTEADLSRQTETETDIVQTDEKVDSTESTKTLTVSELKEQFFGHKVHTMSVEGIIAVDEPLPQINGGGSLDVYMNDFTLEANMKKAVDEDDDSDLSDSEDPNGNYEVSFTSGDNKTGLVPTSVLDGDGEDDGIQLISYNTTITSIQSPASQTDSAFDEMMSSMHSNDLDSSNQISLSNTIDDFQDSLITETVEEVKIDKIESEPELSSPVETPRIPMETYPTSEMMVTPKGQPKDIKVVIKKGQQLSEALTQPPKLTIRATSKDMSEEHIQEVDRQRKAVISQSTVKRRGITDLSTNKIFGNEEDNKVADVRSSVRLDDNDDKDVTVETSFNTSRKSDIKWEDKPDKVDLYSDNIIKEDGNTETVDRESIADLSSTRRQWESMLNSTARAEIQKPTPKKSGTVKHWEVKLPYKPVNSPEDSSTVKSEVKLSPSESEPKSVSFKMNEDQYANESAIEREIRLANEREDMLRKEQEERLELINRQNASKKIVTPQTFETNENNNTEFKTMYNEMTEADRGSELQKRETIIQKEIEEQQERENALKDTPPIANKVEDEARSTESLIAKEIRLQKEREEEIYKQRESDTSNISVEEPQTQATQMTEPESNGLRPNEMSYEEAIATYQHEGESLIARELREAREREEDLRRMRELTSQKLQKPVSQQSTCTPKTTPQETKQKLWQPSPSVQTPIKSSPRAPQNVKFQPLPDTPDPVQEEEVEEKPEPPSNETPIEREIRLARDRENELRSQKGLPLLEPVKNKRKEEAYNEKPKTVEEPPLRTYRRISYHEDGSQKVKHFATSRLQSELQIQKEREQQLRTEGKIKSTSEDHIDSLNYAEVAGIPIGVPGKRNFTTKKSASSYSVEDSPSSSKTPSENGDVEQVKTSVPQPQASKGEPNKFKPAFVKSGGASFSYRESRHRAESKIERELREMREREEELKKMREESGILSPRISENTTEQTVGSRKAQFEMGQN